MVAAKKIAKKASRKIAKVKAPEVAGPGEINASLSKTELITFHIHSLLEMLGSPDEDLNGTMIIDDANDKRIELPLDGLCFAIRLEKATKAFLPVVTV